MVESLKELIETVGTGNITLPESLVLVAAIAALVVVFYIIFK